MLNCINRINPNLIILVFIVLIAAVISIWVKTDSTGEIRGVVIHGETGTPVSGAIVQLREKSLNALKTPVTATTGYDGSFIFTELNLVEFVIEASIKDESRSESYSYHLYFASQDFELPEPITIKQ